MAEIKFTSFAIEGKFEERIKIPSNRLKKNERLKKKNEKKYTISEKYIVKE